MKTQHCSRCDYLACEICIDYCDEDAPINIEEIDEDDLKIKSTPTVLESYIQSILKNQKE